jgi:O-antigen/teichoic acid export membrane protein
MTKYSAAIALPLSAALGLSAGTLIRLWMGPTFADAEPLVHVLLVAFAVTAFNHAGSSALLGMRRVSGLLPRYYVPQAVLNLIISVALVRPLGPLGVALGTAVPALALEYTFIRYVLREIGVPLDRFLREAVVPVVWPLVSFVPLAALYIVARHDSVRLIPVAVACGATYVALFWFQSLNSNERLQLTDVVRARLIPTPVAPKP